MIDEFFVWMADEFMPWLEKAMKLFAIIVGGAATLPFWLLPFLWWFFVARKKEDVKE